MEAADLVSTQEAERRVLVLENPQFVGQSRITNSLYGGLQTIRPGEIARSHRHTQSALRFAIEGRGAFTAVDSEKTYMEPGDLILTPAWRWHDHGCEGEDPCIWFDGLDIPLVAFLGAGFAETAPVEAQAILRSSGDSAARFGMNLLPVDFDGRGKPSPLFSYPYARTREALTMLARRSDWDPVGGIRLRYANPADGGDVLPTISAFAQLLPAGFAGARYRSTDATVYIVVEGTGTTQVGDVTFDWGPKDIFVVPGWTAHRHTASSEAVLFSYSDRTVQQKLGLWREERL